jgi:hypothetical protein
LAETTIRKMKGKGEHEQLSAFDKILSSSIGGALATWNQPIEVVRIEVRNFMCPSYINIFPDQLPLHTDAVHGKEYRKRQSTSKTHYVEYLGLHL